MKPVAQNPRKARGSTAFASGRMGEDSVLRVYLAQGYDLVERRWRGKAGEIDLILRRGEEFVFVEVKTSSEHAVAAERIQGQQIDRICIAATEFCGQLEAGLLTLMRFDAALVDRFGRVEILENAFGG